MKSAIIFKLCRHLVGTACMLINTLGVWAASIASKFMKHSMFQAEIVGSIPSLEAHCAYFYYHFIVALNRKLLPDYYEHSNPFMFRVLWRLAALVYLPWNLVPFIVLFTTLYGHVLSSLLQCC